MTISWPTSKSRRPGRRGAGDPQPLVAVDEVQVDVAGQRAGQQVALAQHLEAVADAEHRHAPVGGVDHARHDLGEAGDRAAAQVVAVGEATRQDDGVDVVQVGVRVPEGDGLGAGQPGGPLGVTVIEAAREGDDADPDLCCHLVKATGQVSRASSRNASCFSIRTTVPSAVPRDHLDAVGDRLHEEQPAAVLGVERRHAERLRPVVVADAAVDDLDPADLSRRPEP